MRKNRAYDEHFKMEAVSLVLDSEKSIASADRELEIAKSVLGNWVTAYKEKGADGFVGSGHLSPEKQAEKDLHKRIRELEGRKQDTKKGHAHLCQPTRVIFNFIDQHRHECRVSKMYTGCI